MQMLFNGLDIESFIKCIEANYSKLKPPPEKILEMYNSTTDVDRISFLNALPYEDMWLHCADLMNTELKQIIDFIVRLPGFDKIEQSTRMDMLKSAVFEMLVIRMSSMFDLQSNRVLFGNFMMPIDQCFTRLQMTDPRDQELVTGVFDAARAFANLRLKHCEIALLQMLVLVWPSRVAEPCQEMHRMHSRCMAALRSELERDPNLMNIMLSLIPVLGDLTSKFKEALVRFRTSHPNSDYPQILTDIFISTDYQLPPNPSR